MYSSRFWIFCRQFITLLYLVTWNQGIHKKEGRSCHIKIIWISHSFYLVNKEIQCRKWNKICCLGFSNCGFDYLQWKRLGITKTKNSVILYHIFILYPARNHAHNDTHDSEFYIIWQMSWWEISFKESHINSTSAQLKGKKKQIFCIFFKEMFHYGTCKMFIYVLKRNLPSMK